MEDYNQVGEGIVRLNHHHQRGNFSNYVAAPNGNNQICSFQLKNSGELCFQAVKNEASTSQSLPSKFHYSILRGQPSTTATATHVYNPDRLHHHQQQHAEEEDDEGKERQGASHDQMDDMKAKIIAHPHYSNLLQAYLDCQKVGAPPEEVARLSAARQEFETRQQSSFTSRVASEDPELDQFMEAYYNMLVKYRDELTRPVQEALDFMRRMEAQLNLLRNDRVRIFTSGKLSLLSCSCFFSSA
ncbi:hypothetical protein Nepgr_005056 [Nepenthes gracilis]|uniref:Uncharacterized protein n=1 Tax=Nepenthes gracilis TaxID=150966 RepID=A0AAD3S2H5_NEPGR|nr:hypothetical protein Nepgr_005056 [Nepenthes gracilis]